MSNILDPKIFNENNTTTFNNGSLLCGNPSSLVDTIELQSQRIFDLYKKLKKQDWDEKEQDYSKCLPHFQSASKDTYDSMMLNITWQWETDSIASRTAYAILAPFISNSELAAVYQAIALNETLHSYTYSEIVKQSFDDPRTVKQDIMKHSQTLQRLRPTVDIFSRAYDVSHKYALGQIDTETAYETALEFIATMLVLERVSFMGSFAITFAHCVSNPGFTPIGFAIKKIAADELEVHVEVGLEVLRHELRTERGQKAWMKIAPKIQTMITDVAKAEIDFIKFANEGGRELPGVTVEKLISFTMFNVGYLCDCIPSMDKLKIASDTGYEFPSKNPLKFIEKWISMDAVQGSPMEQKTTGQYVLNAVKQNDQGKVYDMEF